MQQLKDDQDQKIGEQQKVIFQLEKVIQITKDKAEKDQRGIKQELNEFQDRIKSLKNEVKESDTICSTNSRLQSTIKQLKQKNSRTEDMLNKTRDDLKAVMSDLEFE